MTFGNKKVAPTEPQAEGLSRALSGIKHKLEIGRIWNGMGWTWNHVHGGVAEQCWAIADAALSPAPTEPQAEGLNGKVFTL